MKKPDGYVLLILMLAVFVMGIGLLIAVPVWQTQIQRENEEELIFRGNQYVEAVRVFQMKFPGRFPESLEKLVDEKCIRKLYRDPMTASGEWSLILIPEGPAMPQGGAVQKVLVAPFRALSSLRAPQILGVVSSSQRKSKRIYYDQESYDKWLFFYGQDPDKPPEIIYYGQDKKS